MHWGYLVLAILTEVSGTTCMKLSDGMTRGVPTTLIFVFYIASLGLLAMALKKIDLGMAYAIWAGTGTALIATIGFVYFKDSITAVKIGCIGLIVLGVVGLNLSGGVR